MSEVLEGESSIKSLKDELDQIRRRLPKTKDDAAFVHWFLQAFVVDSEQDARSALTGETGDKGVDAIFIDERAEQVHVVQGKFRQSLNKVPENRNDVLNFVDLAVVPWADKERQHAFFSKLSPRVREKAQEAFERLRKKGYRLQLYYVTTGKVSATIREEARARVREAEGPAEITILDGSRVMTIYRDYIEGVAPAVPSLSLALANGGAIKEGGLIRRVDPETNIEAWVFSMRTSDVGMLFRHVGMRLFARNVRGYLGSNTDINEAMAETIQKAPQNFWYYNNGVTIVCDEARRETEGLQDVLRVEGAQIINGQQTTRTLHESSSDKASVLVKVIKIPRTTLGAAQYHDLVSAIVRATNWQNEVKPSDLVSNDHIQVFLERELRKHGYQYLRKRQTKSEARRLAIDSTHFTIKKDELAQAIAACDMDPAVVRKGKENLFDERHYRDIFRSQQIPFYLSRYWLMRHVKYGARGYPERAYAKWLVMHFVWNRVGKAIQQGDGEKQFRYASEYQMWDELRHFDRAIDAAYRAALAFFRSERGSGDERKDVSTFFLLTGLHNKFERFWATKANNYGAKFDSNLTKFQKSLAKLAIDT
jgi:hypothetical protein